MAKTFADYTGKVDQIIPGRNTSIVSDASRSAFITDAAEEFSDRVPQKKIKDYAGDGSTYSFTLPTDWEEGFSTILRIEYPADEYQDPFYLEEKEWDFWRDSAGAKKLRLKEITPSAGYTMRVTYTIKHVLPGTGTITVPDSYFLAYCYLAAAQIAAAHAAFYANTMNSSISADSVDYQSLTQKWISIQKECLKKFNELVGEGTAIEMADVDLDTTFAGSGLDYQTHPREFR